MCYRPGRFPVFSVFVAAAYTLEGPWSLSPYVCDVFIVTARLARGSPFRNGPQIWAPEMMMGKLDFLCRCFTTSNLERGCRICGLR